MILTIFKIQYKDQNFIYLQLIISLTNHLTMKFDKTYLSLALLIILTTVSWITSCTHKDNIWYSPICFKEVRQIFNNSCAYGTRCHNGTGERDALKTYANIRNSVVPGNPYASRSYQAIIATRGENMMPPNGPLSLENRTIIRLWIEQGAQDSTSSCQDVNAKGGGSDNGFLNN